MSSSPICRTTAGTPAIAVRCPSRHASRSPTSEPRRPNLAVTALRVAATGLSSEIRNGGVAARAARDAPVDRQPTPPPTRRPPSGRTLSVDVEFRGAATAALANGRPSKIDDGRAFRRMTCATGSSIATNRPGDSRGDRQRRRVSRRVVRPAGAVAAGRDRAGQLSANRHRRLRSCRPGRTRLATHDGRACCCRRAGWSVAAGRRWPITSEAAADCRRRGP